MLFTLFLLFLTLFFSAIFSGMEIAFVSLNKIEIELSKKSSDPSTYLSYFQKHPNFFLGTILVGNNLMLVLFGALITSLLDPLFIQVLPSALAGPFPLLLLRTILVTLVVLLFAEFIPKNIFRINPSGKLRFLMAPFAFIAVPILAPATLLVMFISKLFLGNKLKDHSDKDPNVGFTHMELQDYIERAADFSEESDEIDKVMVEKAIELKETLARECMVPRNEIVAIDESEPFNVRKQTFIDHKHSKIILYNNDIDHATGYAFHQDILKKSMNRYELLFFPETELVTEILKAFIDNKKSIALIIDEYGGTAGMITMEDIVEEIFGEIEDEYDADDGLICEQMTTGKYLLSGRVEIDTINERFELDLPEGEYETISGFILEHHQDIPKEGKTIRIEGYKFYIKEASMTKIALIEMTVPH